MCLIDRRSVSPSINQCLSPSSWLLSLPSLILLMNKAAQVMMKGAVWHDNSSRRRRLSLLLPSPLPPSPPSTNVSPAPHFHWWFLFLSPICISVFRLCFLTSLTRTTTRLRSPEETAKLSSTEIHPCAFFFFLTRGNQHRNGTLHSNNKPALTLKKNVRAYCSDCAFFFVQITK